LTLAVAYLPTSLATVLQPVVERVSAQIREACAAAVLDGDDIVFIARASPVRVLSVDLSVGYRLPAYCTALGRALLGGLDDAALDDYLNRIDLQAVTPHTITDKAASKRPSSRIVRRGIPSSIAR
jgi:IclR family pca regulon transcriptional regulator